MRTWTEEELEEIMNQILDDTAPKTNADHIRNMNDYQLANFLVEFQNTFGEEYEGELSCLDWLQSEVDQ